MTSATSSPAGRQPKKRVLCYSPYNMWELHGLWETTILHAMRLRGHEISYSLCDGLYRDCDVFWATAYGYPRADNACKLCQHRVTGVMLKMNMEYQWLGRYLTPEDFRRADAWAAALDPSEFLTVHYEDWNLGNWVESSARSHFRITDFDFSNPAHESVYRNYLHAGLLSAFGLSRQFDEVNPDVVLLFNGRMASLRVALEIARKRGIEVFNHERGLIKEAVSLYHNVPISMAHEELLRYWRPWQDVPLSPHQLRTVIDYVRGREQGQNLSWIPLSPPPDDDLQAVRVPLGLTAERPIWVLFPSSEDEFINDRNLTHPFGSQSEWIEATIDFAARHPQIDLVIRVHPNISAAGFGLVGITGEGANMKQIAYFKGLSNAQLPSNVRVVAPEAKISSYSLMNIATAGMSLLSTTAMELACKGKPAIVAHQSFMAHTPFVRTLETLADYERYLTEFLALPPMNIDKNVARLAHRFAYYLYFRWSLPFPLIKMPDPHTGEPAYQSFDELAPGREESLERICRIMTLEESICQPPRPYDLLLDESAEKAVLGLAPAVVNTPVTREQILQTPAVKTVMPKVSVVIPCYNYASYLVDAVHSLLDQPFEGLEILIVNDGSSDDSAIVAERLLQAYPERAITVIHQPNSGQPAIPRNRGIQAARGQYILCLDADDKLAPGCLAALADCLDRTPHVSVAYPRLREIGSSHHLWRGQTYDPQLLLHWNYIPTAAMYRRQAWLDAGGYKTNVVSHEDWDFWIACLEAGHFGQLVEAATFYYRQHGEGLLESQVKKRLQLKARVIQNHPSLYTVLQQDWARRVLGDDPHVLALALDPSQMPRFENEGPTQALNNLHERWQQAQADPRAALQHRRSGLSPHSLSLRHRAELWQIASPDQAEVFDWWPGSPLPPSLPAQLWVPSERAADLLPTTDFEITPRVLPRFAPETLPVAASRLEIEHSRCLLVILSQHSDWQSQLTGLLARLGPEADLSLALRFEQLDAEESYGLLSDWLQQTGIPEAQLPELVILDADDVPPGDLLQAPVSGLWLDPKADPANLWFTTALTAGCVVMGPEAAPEWLWALTPSALPDWLSAYLPAETLCLQPTAQSLSEWNALIWEKMNAQAPVIS